MTPGIRPILTLQHLFEKKLGKMFYAKYLIYNVFGLSLEVFFKLYYIHIMENQRPPGIGPILTPGVLLEQTW
jgi:hypothetical protein